MSLDKEIEEIKEKLKEHEKRIQYLEKIIFHKTKSDEGQLEKYDDIQKRLAVKINVPEEKLKEIFDLEGDSLTLLKIAGKDDREKTKDATLLVLLGYKYFFGKEEIFSKEIRRNVAEHRIPLNNFATYLNEITPSLIRRKGKGKSPSTTYKLQHLGEAEAKQLLKKIVGDK